MRKNNSTDWCDMRHERTKPKSVIGSHVGPLTLAPNQQNCRVHGRFLCTQGYQGEEICRELVRRTKVRVLYKKKKGFAVSSID